MVYPVVKTVWYIYLFRYNTSVWQTDRQTDRRLAMAYSTRCIRIVR